ncbi:uncharacterized protein LOC128204504 [Mya arenaria]|uniref:uncharacterized protein LOC128204504 n=1 Tax=Mya arenaria TaxID=6604 RepID=UPI0022E53C3B|nr:uncharacterized protein LOC128204504 [Mya arenaria]
MQFAAVCFAREPECSRFHYEEKLLEKVIRSEIKMDAIDESLKKTTDNVEENIQTISGLTNKVQELQSEIEPLKSVEVMSSGIYTRWGRRSCPGTTELVYEGFAGGGKFNDKGASKYETVYATFHTNLYEEDVPCAVCRVVGRSVVMIPARNVCYSGWHTEYSGYLMSSYYGHEGNKELVCMDGNPEKAEGSDSSNLNGALFYFAQAICGSLKCPPYSENKALTCVVCSK